MQKYPKISLYIPTYNASQYLKRVIDAILASSLQPEEIIVVNDGSVDNSEEIARNAGVRVVNQPMNMGLAEARNRAISESKCELIACVDSDVVVETDWLEELANFLLANEGVVGVGGRLDELQQDNIADRWRKEHMSQHWGNEQNFDIPFIFGANGLYKKKALEEVGGFNPSFRTNGEDSNICTRLREHGFKIAYTPKARCWHLKRDTISSLLNAYWKWMRHPICIDRPIDTFVGFLRFSRRRVIHNYTTNFVPDLKNGFWSFLGIDFCIFFYSSYMEAKEFIKFLFRNSFLSRSRNLD